MRSVVFLALVLASHVCVHRHKFLALEDNMSTAGAWTKGRSSSPLLNYLLRRKSASLLAAEIQLLLPWVETTLQPADELSRVHLQSEKERPALSRRPSVI